MLLSFCRAKISHCDFWPYFLRNLMKQEHGGRWGHHPVKKGRPRSVATKVDGTALRNNEQWPGENIMLQWCAFCAGNVVMNKIHVWSGAVLPVFWTTTLNFYCKQFQNKSNAEMRLASFDTKCENRNTGLTSFFVQIKVKFYVSCIGTNAVDYNLYCSPFSLLFYGSCSIAFCSILPAVLTL